MSWLGDLEDKQMRNSQWIKLPVGSEIEITLLDKRKVTDKPRFDYKRKDGTTLGFHHEIITDKGILTCNSFSLHRALENAMVEKGWKILLGCWK